MPHQVNPGQTAAILGLAAGTVVFFAALLRLYETSDSVVRLTRPLTQHLSAILPALRIAIAPVAEFTAKSLSPER